MKRCWFGGGILIFLLVLGLISGLGMERFHRELSESMTQAAALVGEDRAQAQEAADRVRAAWESRRRLAALLNDHAPMELIEENFALLTPAVADADFREACLRLSAQLKALEEAQQVTLANLF